MGKEEKDTKGYEATVVFDEKGDYKVEPTQQPAAPNVTELGQTSTNAASKAKKTLGNGKLTKAQPVNDTKEEVTTKDVKPVLKDVKTKKETIKEEASDESKKTTEVTKNKAVKNEPKEINVVKEEKAVKETSESKEKETPKISFEPESKPTSLNALNLNATASPKKEPTPITPMTDTKKNDKVTSLSMDSLLNTAVTKTEEQTVSKETESSASVEKETTLTPINVTQDNFKLSPLSELCAGFNYDINTFIRSVMNNISTLLMGPQDRFACTDCKCLIIHGVSSLDEDNSSIVLHIETQNNSHAIIKVSDYNYSDCSGELTAGKLVKANVSGKTVSLCSMAFAPKIRFIK